MICGHRTWPTSHRYSHTPDGKQINFAFRFVRIESERHGAHATILPVPPPDGKATAGTAQPAGDGPLASSPPEI
eukprot:3065766-Prymnesium_polylepis.1